DHRDGEHQAPPEPVGEHLRAVPGVLVVSALVPGPVSVAGRVPVPGVVPVPGLVPVLGVVPVPGTVVVPGLVVVPVFMGAGSGRGRALRRRRGAVRRWRGRLPRAGWPHAGPMAVHGPTIPPSGIMECVS